MESNENDIFSEFERQPYVDLTEWRRELVTYNDARLELAEEELHKYLDNSVTPYTHEAVMNRVMSDLVRAYMDQIEPLVQPGDRIRATGDFVYDIYTKSGHDFELDWLEKGSELRGRFQTIVVRDYLDERILDIDPDELTEKLVGTYIRHYGAHIVLAEPIKITPGGGEQSIPDCESVLIPLMYRRLNLTGYPSWDV
jgi:hypothetical protein